MFSERIFDDKKISFSIRPQIYTLLVTNNRIYVCGNKRSIVRNQGISDITAALYPELWANIRLRHNI